MSKSRNRKHAGPGKRIVSVYADDQVYAQCWTRAASLGLSVSRWLFGLAKKDIQKGASFTIEPETASFNPPVSQLAGFTE